MWEISIASSLVDKASLKYIKDELLTHFNFKDIIIAETNCNNICYLSIATNKMTSRIKKFIKFKIAQVLVINFKKKYVMKFIKGLKYSQDTMNAIETTLCDYLIDEDINFAYNRINLTKTFVMDSFFHFRLKVLIYKWKNIFEYVKVNGVY